MENAIESNFAEYKKIGKKYYSAGIALYCDVCKGRTYSIEVFERNGYKLGVCQNCAEKNTPNPKLNGG